MEPRKPCSLLMYNNYDVYIINFLCNLYVLVLCSSQNKWSTVVQSLSSSDLSSICMLVSLSCFTSVYTSKVSCSRVSPSI